MKLVKKLYRKHFISPRGLYTLVSSMRISGKNLMALLRFSAKFYPQRIAITDEEASISYQDLFTQSSQLASVFYYGHHIKPGKKVALLCRNHITSVKHLLALSGTGADLYLLSTDISATQLAELVSTHSFDLLIHDHAFGKLLEGIPVTAMPVLSKTNDLPQKKMPKQNAGKLVVLTSGTSGKFKTAARKTSATNFIRPFFALLKNMDLDQYPSVYVATPVTHGFGLAALCISIALGTHVFITEKFDAAKACQLVKQNQIPVITLVPLMLQRMMRQDPAALSEVKCMIAGGAPLTTPLANDVLNTYGEKLYNLYGTSEAGFTVMALPADLQRAPGTIGKKIKGVKLALLDNHNNPVKTGETGQLCIRANWAVNKNKWTPTGDTGYMDERGYVFLLGRTDDMIVSGGQNVYPVELENILRQHPDVSDVLVAGIKDDDFGQRLKAFVVMKDKTVSEQALMEWIKSRAARYQVPKTIAVLNEIPYNSLGKPDKKQLVG